jgi:hypothetical protein
VAIGAHRRLEGPTGRAARHVQRGGVQTIGGGIDAGGGEGFFDSGSLVVARNK